MADYCRDCSIAMFGRDFRDMAQLLPSEAYKDGTGALVLCECCGPIVVDINGRRIDGQEFHKSCSCADFTKANAALEEYKEKGGTSLDDIIEELKNDAH